MSFAGTPLARGAAVATDDERRLPLGPAEGWTSVLLLVLMAALVGRAIDDSHWVLGDRTLTSFLPWAGVFGVLWGITAAKAGRGRLLAHVGGAVIATVYLTLVVGSQLASGETVGGLFQATSDSVTEAYLDLVVRDQATTTEVGHFLLVLGIICWSAGHFAGYTAVALRRPVAAVLLLGAILLGNVLLTIQDQFPLLVVFSLAALLFLVRFHAADEQRAWIRHRIGDLDDALGLSLRTGTTFVVAAVAGALILTNLVSSAPLANAWPELNESFTELAKQVVRYFPAGGPGTRITGTPFADSITVTGAWVSDSTAILTIQTPAGSPRTKWRAVAYDRLTGSSWTWSQETEVSVEAFAVLLDGTRDAPLDGVRYVKADYRVSGLGAGSIVVTPGIPALLDRAARVTLVKSGGETSFGRILPVGSGSYGLEALLPDLSRPDDPQTFTANRLRAAGTAYPPDLLAAYAAIEPGTVGPETRALLTEILGKAQPKTPYDTARAIEAYLRDSRNFTYVTDVTNVDCDGRGLVDCFVFSRRGYCEHYASTMVMMLRTLGIPARFVEGFLPGDRDASGREVIRRDRAHAWVEVWFPGSGWVDFDPTGGGVGRPVALPAGPVAASPTPSAIVEPTTSPGASRRAGIPEPEVPASGAGATGLPTPGVGPVIALVLAFVGALFWLAFVLLRRRLRRPAEPLAVYRTVAGMAGRLGYPRRSTQTVYEYLGSLSDVVPAVRPDLQLVARTTVEAVYGQRKLDADRLSALGEARRRLRVALLRLVLVRRGRRRG